jgi:hypothetical protein
MLRPTKHSHPDRTLIGVAYVLLAFLKKRRIAEFSQLKELAKGASKGSDTLLLPAVNLLFLIGVLEYRAKIDSFEYVGKS